jgi:hypothetical protein
MVCFFRWMLFLFSQEMHHQDSRLRFLTADSFDLNRSQEYQLLSKRNKWFKGNYTKQPLIEEEKKNTVSEIHDDILNTFLSEFPLA